MTAVLLFCSYLLLGSVTGTFAYVLTSRLERISASVLKPISYLAYLALFAATKIGLERIGSRFWIAVGIVCALWLVAIVLRRCPQNVFGRFEFFACVLLMASIIGMLGLSFLTWLCIFTNTLTFPSEVYVPHVYITYIVATVISVFSAPLLEHLYRFAMTMWPKPN